MDEGEQKQEGGRDLANGRGILRQEIGRGEIQDQSYNGQDWMMGNRNKRVVEIWPMGGEY